MNAPVDVVAQARKDACWQRDYTRDCSCPWRWNRDGQRWERDEAAACGVHRYQRVVPASCTCDYTQSGKRVRMSRRNPDCPWHTS